MSNLSNNGFESAPTPPAQRVSPIRWVFRGLVGVAVVGSFLIWIYALSGVARQPPPDEFDSTRGFIEATEAGEDYTELDGLPAYAKRADVICAAVIEDLPDASDASNGAERAAQLRRSNAQLQAMLVELEGLPMLSDRDRELRRLWLQDWGVLIGDRARYADAVEVDPAAVFTVSPVAEGERLERRLDRFARTNLMRACSAPTDVG